jgi:hypothetical protein
MRTRILLAALAIAAATPAMAHDPSGRPEAGTNFAPHVVGSEEAGTVAIHRPDATSHDNASAGVPAIRGGADQPAVDYTGPGRGDLGTGQPARVTGNEDGVPQVTRGAGHSGR